MNAMAGQFGLFDTDRGIDPDQTALGRARMLEMIARLREATTPPWKDEVAVILDDGSFRRAMRLVPEGEAQVLWTAFDAEMERLYTIFAATRA